MGLRKQAKLAGEKKYFNDKPCGRGHVTYRYVSTGKCCKCEKIRAKKWHKQKTYKQFGLTEEQVKILLVNQHYCCLICKKKFNSTESKRDFVIDHDHVTGMFRGLICSNCNLVLGNAFDSPQILAESITYLLSHKGVDKA